MDDASSSDQRFPRISWLWRGLLALWFVVLWLGPDPRPLGAPDWAVDLASLLDLSEPAARAAASLVLRVGGLALLGALLMLAIGARHLGRAAAIAILLAPVLAVAALWANYGYFPITTQIQIAAASAALGALAGLALRRNLIAAVSIVVLTAGVFTWGTAMGIDDELDAAARATGQHLMAAADQVPDGDAGFVRLLEIAFSFAEDNSHNTDPVLLNRAAILALGVILGDERVADLAQRQIDESLLPEAEALRERITAYGRPDWPRHFWVSAALTLISDADRSIVVGLIKELMDAAPGGSGFSFSDLAADAAGNAFALAATQDAASARATQQRIMRGARIEDYLPHLDDLPEGLTRDQLQTEYGGLGGGGRSGSWPRSTAALRRSPAPRPGSDEGPSLFLKTLPRQSGRPQIENDAPYGRVIVDEVHSGHRFHDAAGCFRGSVNEKRAPCARLLSTGMVPP